MSNFWHENMILKTYRGSIAYGTNITSKMAKKTGLKESDKDTMGICIPPLEHYFGLPGISIVGFEQHEDKDTDEVIYSLKKYLNLASQCNPNIVEMLFVNDNHIVHQTLLGQRLIDNRYLFLTKRVKHTYSGYAYSQMQKLKIKQENMTGRKELAETYGYDVKFASHVIRLLTMGLEALVEGELIVNRPNKALLMDIRMGKYTLKEIDDMAKSLNDKLETAYISSQLPNKPDYKKIHQLCIDMHEEFFKL